MRRCGLMAFVASWLGALALNLGLPFAAAFTRPSSTTASTSASFTRSTAFTLSMTDDGNDDTESRNSDNDAEEEMPPIVTSTVRIDDGGSDLTERFKYKVNALMGAFDPADASQDTENNSGNILNAIVRFPIFYTFTVVGKTMGDEDLKNQFIQSVKDVVLKETRENEENVTMMITPRGSKFTKVALSVEVQSAQVISAIYEGLKATELSVMQF